MVPPPEILSGHQDLLLLYKGQIDLGQGILMLPYYYGRNIPVKQENILLEALQQVLL